MKILVTGSSGFIGGHLMKFLKKEGHTVVPLDIKVSSLQDIRNRKTLLQYMSGKGIEAVAHLAAIPSVMQSIKDPLGIANTNVMGTLNLLDACIKLKIKKFVFASSCSVYGNSPQTLRETMFCEPTSPYAASKRSAEAFLDSYSECYDIETMSLRYTNVYGPGQNPRGAYALVIPKFLELAGKGKPLTIYGDGEQTRDFVHVHDVCRANLLAIKSGKQGVVNIGSGKSTTVNAIAKLISDNIKYLPARKGEVYKTSSDITKARKLLKYRPLEKVEEYVRREANGKNTAG